MSNTIIHGYFGNDVDMRSFPDGTPVGNFSVAETKKWKDKETQQPREKTTWFRCVAIGKRAEVISQYFQKGREILITQSEFRTREYEKDGVKQYMSEFLVNGFEFCGKKSSDGGDARTTQQGQDYAPQNNPPVSDFDDDIPF